MRVTLPVRHSAGAGIAALALAVAACTGGGQPANNDSAVEQPVTNLPAVPRPDPALDRAGLLSEVARAASRSASGLTDPAAQALDGRPFEVRIRFGCRGPSADLDETWLGWSYEPERRRLRVRARPTIAKNEPLLAALTQGEFEAVEGFWLPRPWLLEPVCPAAAAVKPGPEQQSPPQTGQQPQPSPQSLETQPEAPADPLPRSPRIGIAQFFTDSDPRTGRRDNRPYESIETLEEGQPLGSQGYILVLSGRLRAIPGAGVIGCSSQGSNSPPECIVGAEFDRVWIEEPETRAIVAQWGSS